MKPEVHMSSAGSLIVLWDLVVRYGLISYWNSSFKVKEFHSMSTSFDILVVKILSSYILIKITLIIK